MALNKTLSFKNVPISYHKISFVNSNFRGKTTDFTISSYEDHEARIENIDNFLSEESYSVKDMDQNGDVRETIYAWLKANVEKYSDATDL